MNQLFLSITTHYAKYNSWRDEQKEKIGYRAVNFLINAALAVFTMLPLLYAICTRVPFTYEVNDDSAMSQIMNGSYTGTPDAHAVFIRYPLSLLIKLLYEKAPSVTLFGEHYEQINWYVAVFVLMETVALVCVLFRLLNYFQRNRLLICVIYAAGFLKIWMECFSSMTFSTAAAFMGCMALAFFALESDREAFRPWNIMLLCFFVVCAYCLRKQCLYMVIPFLFLEFIRKFHIEILKSARPWIILFVCAVAIFGCNYMHTKMYGSQEWKKFMIYNHARAHLQDYGGFPDYEKEKEFFEEHNISRQEKDSLQNYRYCLLDDCDPELIEDLYAHVKEQEEDLSMKEKLLGSLGKAKKYMLHNNNSPKGLKYASFYLWLVLVPIVPLTIICQRKKGWSLQIRNFLYAFGSGVFLLAEWIYLALNGRFPQRVEETIRLVMLVTALIILCHYLKMWENAPLTKIHPVIQVVVVALTVVLVSPLSLMSDLAVKQKQMMSFQTDKIEIIDWCSERPENIYIFDTNAVVTPLKPSDNYENSNWYVSGSWLAYSPLYEEKLAVNNLNSLGSETLIKDNVYLITKSTVGIDLLLGIDEDKEVEAEQVETICTQTANYYTVYKVKKYTKSEMNESDDKKRIKKTIQ